MYRALSALILLAILSMYGLIAYEVTVNVWPDEPRPCVGRPYPNCETPAPPIVKPDHGEGLPDEWKPM